MNAQLALGVALTLAGVVGYAVGVATPFPGRSFALTALMVGLTIAAIGRTDAPGSGGAS